MIGFAGVVVAAYISTNIDDLLLLIGFFAHPDYSAAKIVGGQFIGIAVLVAVSFVCALAAVLIPAGYIGLLGLAPIYLGCTRLLTHADLAPRPAASARRQVLTVTAATIADGGDNIATYVPLFADSSGRQRLFVFVTFGALTAFWCWLAHIMVLHPTTGRYFRAWSACGLPLLLIAIGVVLLWRSGSFGLLHLD